MYGIIYKITNLCNRKCYIGQTTQTLKHRWSQHPYDGCCTHLYNSINKYGKENFTIEQIDSADSMEELNQKEIYWISYFQATNENFGYNIAPGGYKGKHSKETKQKISKALSGPNNFWYGKKQPKEMIEKRRKSMLGHITSEETKSKIKESNPQKLEIYCPQTNRTYFSISEAARQLNLTSIYICRVLNGSRTHVKGYTFKYTNETLNVPPKKNLTREELSKKLQGRLMKNSKTIYCNNGKIYESSSRAARDCGIPAGQIFGVLSGKRTMTNGYKFSFTPLSDNLIKSDREIKEEYALTKGKGIAKPVICNNTIIFKSIKAASKVLNMGQGTIKRSIEKNQIVKSNFEFKYYA